MKTIPRFLFPLFVVIFLIVLPLILAYTAGYRFDFASGELTRLGIIIIDGKPKQTRVFFGDTFSDKLPVTFHNVRPDFYTILLRSDGYHPLTLRRELRSGESLVFSPVFLLKDAVPELVREARVIDISAADDRSVLFIVTRDDSAQHLWKFVPSRNEWTELYKTDIIADWRVTLNADSSIALLSFNDTHRLVWADGSRILTLAAHTPLWSADDPFVLYYIDDEAFVSSLIDNSAHMQTRVLARSVKHIVTISADHAWLVRIVDTVEQLVSYNLSSGETIFIDTWPDDNVVAPSAGDIPLITKGTEIYRAFPDRISSMGSYDQHSVVWEYEHGFIRALIYNSFDVGLWTSAFDRIQTITRFSGDVRAATPLFGTEYVLIARASDVVAIHTGSSDRTYTTLLDNARIDALVSNERGTGVYLAGTIGTQSGLFFLPLRDE